MRPWTESATGRSQWEDPRARDFLPPYQVDPPVRLPGPPMQLPSPPMSYATAASSRLPANQVSSGRVAVVGGMTIEPLLTVSETVVSEEVNGRYAKHDKKYGKSRKHRKHSSDEADDDRTGGKETKGRKDGKVGQEDKRKKKEEEEFEFLEILVSTDGLCENDMTERLTIADNDSTMSSL